MVLEAQVGYPPLPISANPLQPDTHFGIRCLLRWEKFPMERTAVYTQVQNGGAQGVLGCETAN